MSQFDAEPGVRTAGIIVIPPLVIFIALAGVSQAAELKTLPAPRYDTASVVDMPVTVTEIRDAAGENGLTGVRLLARTESDVPIDVYLGPKDFVKGFDITFVKGDRLQIIGSKIKLNSGVIVLAREVHKGSETLYLRDKNGTPFW